MSHALRGLSTRPPINREDSWNPNTSSRALDVDGVLRSKKQNEEDHGIESRSRSTTAIPSDDSGSETHVEERQRNRRKSIEVVLEKSGKKGEYKFTAKDPEFQEVLQTGLRREAEKLNRKNKGRPRDLIFTQQFTTFDRQNVTASQSPFRGFFTLFWLAMAILLIRIAAGNYRTTGSIFGNAEILHLMVDKELFVMLATDLGMCATTVFGFFLQKAIAKDYLTWNGSGWIVQSLWQAFFTFTFIWITFWREWPWTHTVFIVLHVFVLLMKQHAYAFYNGYLSRVYRRRNILQDMLRELDAMKSQEGSTETTHLPEMSTATNVGTPNEGDLTRRGRKYSPQLSDEELEIAGIGQAIDSGKPLDSEQIEGFRRVLNTEITILNEDLRGKCTTTDNIYPNNLKFYNFLEWSCFPTLVYDLEYPRQDRINWWYVAEKSAATLGGIWVMIIISQAYIYPVVVETVRRKEAGMSLDQGWKEFPWIVSDMVFPMLLQSLLSFYVIWECLLNVLAELTRFADRGFYGPWWNSISFDQYARDWNRPVHNFLLRHVYHSSISFFHMSRMQATFFTFFLSAVVHEVVMFCLFKKVRGYLFAFQLTQIPQAAFCKSRFMKGRDTLGNVIFWFGIFIGPSLIMGLYLIM
ncbi:hypothetical protein COCMIDRAFT_79731 [Bipolaris oryzae ATCC 44560]|uniref:O-acyltransferase n=1 Tax=Bipolaris oryzae ATCC 44560 TaxID=930090 RepID=W7A5E3_COCMI|nr:uncharacterized protein COCMIDRAFT_79731 [Bipolaris oryzae ATCC 44560]EUC51351.1 hypothetical protein COCMIDRAFT_79731 [Bipolaris oryzae ATCC 44560]